MDSGVALRSASGSASEGTRNTCSPPMPSASRLLASIFTCGQARKRASASCAQASSRCSQLSNRSSACRSFRCSASVCVIGLPGTSFTPSAVATVCGTSFGSASGASSASQPPSGNSPSTVRASCRTRRVLPTPPLPYSVSRRACDRRCNSSSSSLVRPTNDATCSGRLLSICRIGTHSESLRATRYTFELSSGGTKTLSAVPTSNSSIGSAKPFMRQCPCDCTRNDVSPSAARASRVSSVWPPRASDTTRAAAALATPSTSIGLAPSATSAGLFSRSVTGPTCTPARALSGKASWLNACWYASA